jgi:hypothetical protein
MIVHGCESHNGVMSGGGKQGKRWEKAGADTVGPKGGKWSPPPPGYKPKNLLGIPWKVAFALQADGWYLRSDVIWSKPNPMRESVRDRPTKSHEYLFLLAKRPRYFYDAIAVREKDKGADHPRRVLTGQPSLDPSGGLMSPHRGLRTSSGRDGKGANKLSVWTVTTRGYKGAHFATFPPKLIEPCVKAGTSGKGCCPRCGAPWVRVVERTRRRTRPGAGSKILQSATHRSDINPDVNWRNSTLNFGNRDPGRHVTETRTLGWESSCGCLEARDPVPCVVLDPFNGSGTTGEVARQLGRRYVGTELNADYLELSRDRVGRALLSRPKARKKPAAPGDEPLPLFRLFAAKGADL